MENLGSSASYLSHHAEEFSAEDQLKYFGTQPVESLGAEQLLRVLRLKSLAVHLSLESCRANFDDTIDAEASNYVLAVYFDADGALLEVAMES